MEHICPICHRELRATMVTCEYCGNDLAPGGQLMEALTLHEQSTPSHTLSQLLVPWSIVAFSGILTKLFDSYVLLGAGIIAAASFYHILRRKHRVIRKVHL